MRKKISQNIIGVKGNHVVDNLYIVIFVIYCMYFFKYFYFVRNPYFLLHPVTSGQALPRYQGAHLLPGYQQFSARGQRLSVHRRAELTNPFN